MKKHNVILGIAAAVMVLTAAVPNALAYFTTYVSARGSQEVVLRDETRVQESVKGNVKSITITSDPNSEPVYVRAKAFAPNGYTLTFTGTGWTTEGDAEGWHYYEDTISKGGSAETLDVKFTIPEGTKVGDTFNVIVIYEYTPELFREENGELVSYADWSKKVTYSGTSESEVVPDNSTEGTGGENG